eukprot:TRINITY_DN23762_c0_g2_i1.p1 TRINITY_DN23762_c0_g2~~TRINITY_DN23762_c0_g2_i1.p1  ORF type:complete len:850 (+),score=183.48 TRINITY_DN23762_c0_g2_i1:320-2869(+)
MAASSGNEWQRSVRTAPPLPPAPPKGLSRSRTAGGPYGDDGFSPRSLGAFSPHDLGGGGTSPVGFARSGSLSPPNGFGRQGTPGSPPGTLNGGRLGTTTLELVVSQLRRAEQNLVAEHERALRLLGLPKEEGAERVLTEEDDLSADVRPPSKTQTQLGKAGCAEGPSGLQTTNTLLGGFMQGKNVRNKLTSPGFSRNADSEDLLLGPRSAGRALPASPARPSKLQVQSPDSDAPRFSIEQPQEECSAEIKLPNCVYADDAHLNAVSSSDNTPKVREEFTLHPVFLKNNRKPMERKKPKRSRSGKKSLRLLDDEEDLKSALTSEGCMQPMIMNPNCRKRSTWDILSMILVLYDMVMIPFGLFEPEPTVFLKIMEWIGRFFWTSDMPISFCSGFVTKDGRLELRPWPVAKKYLKSWFPLDCLVVGVDWVDFLMGSIGGGAGFARMGKASRVFRILRMLRLLRLAKVGEIINLLMERLPSKKIVIFLDIAKLIIAMLGVGHLVACIWYLLGTEGPVDRNWLVEYSFDTESLEYRYIMSMRWALSQFAGGMDEVTPQSIAEHIFSGFIFIAAFWSGNVFLSILTSNMTQLYILGNEKTQQLNVMRKYLNQNGISRNLALRVARNAQHQLKCREKATPESATGLVELVSLPLRIELHFEMYFPTLGNHQFFTDFMAACPHVVRQICHSAMATHTLSQGDVIFHQGEASIGMRIVKAGLLLYTWGETETEMEEESLKEGSWISEAALWTDWAHRGILSALKDSVVFSVDTKPFRDIIEKFAIAGFDLSAYAQGFIDRLNCTSEEVTDLPLLTPEELDGRKVESSKVTTLTKITKGVSMMTNPDVKTESAEFDEEF